MTLRALDLLPPEPSTPPNVATSTHPCAAPHRTARAGPSIPADGGRPPSVARTAIQRADGIGLRSLDPSIHHRQWKASSLGAGRGRRRAISIWLGTGGAGCGVDA